MSRLAKRPIPVPAGVTASLANGLLVAKGPKGEDSVAVHSEIDMRLDDGAVSVKARSGSRLARSMTGTTCALVRNLFTGVTAGFERRLQLVGTGYRAEAQGSKLALQLGFSHPVEYQVAEGVSVKTPSQTEIVLESVNRQRVGQTAAEIRAIRPPEPYKGKGVRYRGEQLRLKEAKKK
ncbi:50S ribosomal protein L6 [Candidatus Foliamicus sp.]